MIGDFEANGALDEVPAVAPEAVCDAEAQPVFGPEIAAVFQPALRRANLTFSAPYTTKPASAAGVVVQDPRASVAQVTLDELRPGSSTVRWGARADLLDSDPLDRHFAVEVDDERVARVRFGEALEAGGSFRAQYRIGNGRAGNVGADSIRHIVSRGGFVTGRGLDVRNPLAAAGGLDPEPVADVRLTAPHAFRATLERAVTPDDYARLAERHHRAHQSSRRDDRV
jgi:predicted phage baseplate assembly protein